MKITHVSLYVCPVSLIHMSKTWEVYEEWGRRAGYTVYEAISSI